MFRSSRLVGRIIWWCCAALLATQLLGIHAHREAGPGANGHGHFEWHFAHSGLYAFDASSDTDGSSGHGDSNADGLKSFVMKTFVVLAIVLPSCWFWLMAPATELRRIPAQQARRVVDRPPRYSIKPPTHAPPLH